MTTPRLPNIKYRHSAEQFGMQVAKRLGWSLSVTPDRNGGFNYLWTDAEGNRRISGWSHGKRRDGIESALEHIREMAQGAA